MVSVPSEMPMPPIVSGLETERLEASHGGRLLRDRASHGPAARALLSHCWDATPLGSLDTWPDQLQLLVDVMLSSEFPMMLVWGRELTQLYNDAFRPILGREKHPGALGGSARDTWAEIWDEIGPLFSQVIDAGEAVWSADHRLLIERNGYAEETFFTYSYSPIRDATDEVAGLLVIATETTAQVVDRRRLGSIGSLASSLVSATTIESVANATVRALRGCDDIPALEIDLIVGDGIVRIASLGYPVTSAADRDGIRNAATTEGPVVLDVDWEPGLPARRVAFGIDDPTCRPSSSLGSTRAAPTTRSTNSSSGWSVRRSRRP